MIVVYIKVIKIGTLVQVKRE